MDVVGGVVDGCSWWISGSRLMASGRHPDSMCLLHLNVLLLQGASLAVLRVGSMSSVFS